MLGGCLGGALLSLLVPLVLVKKGLDRLLPEANFVAMSISSLALIGILQPNLLTRSRQEVPTSTIRLGWTVSPAQCASTICSGFAMASVVHQRRPTPQLYPRSSLSYRRLRMDELPARLTLTRHQARDGSAGIWRRDKGAGGLYARVQGFPNDFTQDRRRNSMSCAPESDHRRRC